MVGLFPDRRSRRGGGARGGRGAAPRPRSARSRSWWTAREPPSAIEPLMLSMASTFSLEATVDLVHRHGGLALAAHVDRRSFSVPSQLGFIPPGTAFQALEVSAHGVRVGRAAAFARAGVRADHGLRRARARAGRRRRSWCSRSSRRSSASSPSRSPARTAGGARLRELSLHVLDLVENSLRAGAGVVEVGVEEQPDRDLLAITVEDDGPGLAVDPAQALDPFYTTKEGKRTGLGLSLFRQQVEMAGGGVELGRSALGGLAVRARLGLGSRGPVPARRPGWHARGRGGREPGRARSGPGSRNGGREVTVSTAADRRRPADVRRAPRGRRRDACARA